MRRISLQCAVLCLLTICGHQALAQDESTAGLAGGQMVRGVVSAATANNLAIRTDKGEIFQITVTDNTHIMKDRQPLRITAIRAGDNVGAMGVLDAPNHTVHALFVVVVDAEEAKKAREGLGKIYIAGKVTAIDELKLTILRPDGVSQVIAVDESTSFRKGGRQLQSAVDGSGPAGGMLSSVAGGPAEPSGESVTLADIKVGDNVAGKGELKSGVFVPSQLGIGDPARQRRKRQDGSTSGPGSQ
jgi:hypothetical protein